MAIILGNNNIDFEKLSLGIPNQLQKNLYFSRIFLDDAPIYIQTNECFTSTGIKETNKKGFCDLVYKDFETVTTFFGSLENKIRDRVLENSDEWFEDSFTSDDLEDSFTTSIGYHKQGIRLRTYLHKNSITEIYNFNCYNFNHELISNDKLTIGSNLIPIIEIVGIKFTDKSFTVELKLVQVLITDLEHCNDTPKSMFSGLINSVKEQDSEINEEAHIEGDRREPKKETITFSLNESTDILNEDNKEVEQVKNEEEDVKNQVETLMELEAPTPENEDNKESLDKTVKEDENKSIETVEKKDCIEEIDIYGKIVDDDTPVKLKTHADIYKEIWKMYRAESFKVRQQNIKFMLNSKNVHTNYLINEI